MNWIAEEKTAGVLVPSSLCRYQSDYNRFFPEDEDFCKIPIYDISESQLEAFIKATIRKTHLTRKAYGGLRTLLCDVFSYAKRRNHTDINIRRFFDETLNLPESIFCQREDDEMPEVFTLEEVEKLTSYLYDHPSIRNLGTLLQFYTGIRIGELTALKPSDNRKDGYLYIRRTEFTRPCEATNKKATYIKNFPKTAAGWRTIVVPENAQAILDRLKKDNANAEFLLSENYVRVTQRKMNYNLRKACDAIGIPPRSTHKIRRTYASLLLANGVDSAFVKAQMGHSEISTTEKYYHYDIYSEPEKQLIVNRIFSF